MPAAYTQPNRSGQYLRPAPPSDETQRAGTESVSVSKCGARARAQTLSQRCVASYEGRDCGGFVSEARMFKGRGVSVVPTGRMPKLGHGCCAHDVCDATRVLCTRTLVNSVAVVTLTRVATMRNGTTGTRRRTRRERDRRRAPFVFCAQPPHAPPAAPGRLVVQLEAGTGVVACRSGFDRILRTFSRSTVKHRLHSGQHSLSQNIPETSRRTALHHCAPPSIL